MLCTTSDPLPGPPATVHINVSRLIYQCIVIAILGAGLLLMLKVPRTTLSVIIAALILGVGVIGSMALAFIDCRLIRSVK